MGIAAIPPKSADRFALASGDCHLLEDLPGRSSAISCGQWIASHAVRYVVADA